MSTKTERKLKEQQERHLTKVEQIDARLDLMKRRAGYNKRTAEHKRDTREKILTGVLLETHWRNQGADNEKIKKSKETLFNSTKESMRKSDRDFLRSRGYEIEPTDDEK
jgi:hypothetical protein